MSLEIHNHWVSLPPPPSLSPLSLSLSLSVRGEEAHVTSLSKMYQKFICRCLQTCIPTHVCTHAFTCASMHCMCWVGAWDNMQISSDVTQLLHILQPTISKPLGWLRGDGLQQSLHKQVRTFCCEQESISRRNYYKRDGMVVLSCFVIGGELYFGFPFSACSLVSHTLSLRRFST